MRYGIDEMARNIREDGIIAIVRGDFPRIKS